MDKIVSKRAGCGGIVSNETPDRLEAVLAAFPDMPYAFGFGSIFLKKHMSHCLPQLIEPEGGFQGILPVDQP